MVSSSVMAQLPLPPVRINESDLKKRMSRSDGDINDPKRNTRYKTWFDRGELYFNVGMVGSDELYRGMPKADLEQRYDVRNPPSAQKKSLGNTEYNFYKYQYFEAYMNDEDKLMVWDPTIVVDADAFAKSYEAYAKAYEINPNQKENLKLSLERLGTAIKQEAINFQQLDKREQSADAFMLAGKVLSHPIVGAPDTVSMYNAGRLYLMENMYDKAIEALNIVKGMDYFDDGDVYYYIFHAYRSKEDMENAKNTLMEGVKLYPGNEKLTSSLAAVFASGKVEGDMSEVLALVEKASADDPNNIYLLSGLGDMYNQAGQPEKAYEVYKRVVTLKPDNFVAWAIIGNSEFNKAYEGYVEFRNNSKNYTSKTEYDAKKKEVLQEFMTSVASLERAHQLDPANKDVVSLLKDATFLLRDDFPEMATKNNTYTTLFESMQ